MSNLEKIGAFWTKTDKKGVVYFTGNLELDGKKIKAQIFKNGYKKEGSNEPDYRIFMSNDAAQAKQTQQPYGIKDETVDDIPF